MHPYLPNSASKVKEEMLKILGISDIDELYVDVPSEIRFKGELNIPGPYTELEVSRKIREILSANRNFWKMPFFLGAGCWPHYVPSAVKYVISLSLIHI